MDNSAREFGLRVQTPLPPFSVAGADTLPPVSVACFPPLQDAGASIPGEMRFLRSSLRSERQLPSCLGVRVMTLA